MGERVEGVTGTEVRPEQSALRRSFRAFGHRDFTLFFAGALVSNAGTWLQNVTVPYVIFKVTGSAGWVGLSTFGQFMPMMLCSPIGGAIADRYERRRVLVVTQAALAVLAAAQWLLWAGGNRSPTMLIAVSGLGGVVNGLNMPSWQAFVPSLVPRRDLSSAIALNSLQFNAARAIGPAVAGALLATLGASWSFALNALSFLFVIAALVVVRADSTPDGVRDTASVLVQFRSALAYIRTQPGIGASMVIAVIVGFLGNPITQMTVVFADDVYKVGALGFGILSAAAGVGALAAAPLVSTADERAGRGQLIARALPVYAIAVIAFAVSPNAAVGTVALLVSGGGFLAVISASNTAVQAIVADRVRGRVMAVRIMSFMAAYPVGGLLQGWAADYWGPRRTVAGAGVGLLLCGVALRRNRTLLHRLDDPPDES